MQQLLEHIKQDSFLKNFSFLTIGQVLSRVMNMFSCIILARWLSPSGYGEYSLFVTYVALFGVVASLGMNYIINRVVARDPENSKKYLIICFLWRIVGFIIAAISLLVYAKISDNNILDSVLLFILAGVFLDSLWSGQQSVAFGMQKMEWNSLLEVLSSFFALVMYIVTQKVSTDLFNVRNVIIIYLGLYLIKDVAYYIVLKQKRLLKGSVELRIIKTSEFRSVLKQGIPFYIMALVGLFTNQFPIIFLEQNAGINEVAFFNTANKLLLPITIMLGTALTALFPNQSILYINNQDSYWLQINKMMVLLCLVGGLMAFAITLFKDELVLLLFGQEYASTGDVLSLQSWYIVLFALLSLNGNALGASDRQKLLSVESIVYAAITTPIIFYTSHQGAAGLSKGYLIASCINAIFLFFLLHKVSNNRVRYKNIILGIGYLVILFVLSFFLLRESLIVYRAIILSVIFFAALVFIYKNVGKKVQV